MFSQLYCKIVHWMFWCCVLLPFNDFLAGMLSCTTQRAGWVWIQSGGLSTLRPHWTASLLMSMTINTLLSSSPLITVSVTYPHSLTLPGANYTFIIWDVLKCIYSTNSQLLKYLMPLSNLMKQYSQDVVSMFPKRQHFMAKQTKTEGLRFE